MKQATVQRWEKNLQDIITDPSYLVPFWSQRHLTGKPTQPGSPCLGQGWNPAIVTVSSAGAPRLGLPVDGVLMGLAGKAQATEEPIEGTIKVGMGRQGLAINLGTETPPASQGLSLGPKPSFSATATIFYPHQCRVPSLSPPTPPGPVPLSERPHVCRAQEKIARQEQLDPGRWYESQGGTLHSSGHCVSTFPVRAPLSGPSHAILCSCREGGSPVAKFVLTDGA